MSFLRNILYAKAVFGVSNRTRNKNKTFIFEHKSFQLNKRRAIFKFNYLLILLFETKIIRANSWSRNGNQVRHWLVEDFRIVSSAKSDTPNYWIWIHLPIIELKSNYCNNFQVNVQFKWMLITNANETFYKLNEMQIILLSIQTYFPSLFQIHKQNK